MVLYVDETENDSMFLVAGLLVDSEETVRKAYKRFKKSVKEYSISPRVKTKIFTEFKSTLMDGTLQRVKRRMLEEVCAMKPLIVYGSYRKVTAFDQQKKELAYITLLSSILKQLQKPSVVFDAFGKPDFEKKIIRSLIDEKLTEQVMPGDSQCIWGLQFADNVCSVLRLYKTEKDVNDYFSIIRDYTHEI